MTRNRRGSPTYRSTRPIDIIAAPPKIKTRGKGSAITTRQLPDSWVTIIDAAEDWPYPDPDENGLADPVPSFAEFPAHPAELPDVEPFSEAEPWGIMSSETLRDYQLFDHYRSLNITRTRKAVADHFGLARATIELKAAERNWDARARAWDEYRERVYTAELIQGVKEMAHSHAEIARDGINALAVAFEAIVSSMEDDDSRADLLAELNELPARQRLAIAQKSAQVIPNLMNAERLSRGLPTEISANLSLSESRVTIQTTDDLAAIIAGILGPLSVAQSDELEGEIIEVDS